MCSSNPPCRFRDKEGSRSERGLTAAVDRDREVERDLFGGRLLLLEARQDEARARRRGEQPPFDLVDVVDLRQLRLERAREAAAPEVPPVELLQEARCLPLSELAHRLAHEEHELRDDL